MASIPALSRAASKPATQPAAKAPTTQPQSLRKNLFAHGNDVGKDKEKYLWLAHVVPNPAGSATPEQTRIFFRTGGKNEWHELSPLPNRVTALGNLGAQAAVVLESGEWMLLADEEGDGGSSGDPLPGGAKIVAITSTVDTLWAVGVGVPLPGKLPATTEAASASTRPATAPATTTASIEPADRLMLFMRKANEWTPAGGPPIPNDVPLDAPLSLAIIDSTPYLAVERANHTIDILRQTPTGWTHGGHAGAPAEAGAFKLISGLTPPTLWIAGQTADELIVMPAGESAKTINLKETGAPINERTAVYAVNLIREIAMVDGKPVENDYDPQTYAIEKPATITLPGAASPPMAAIMLKVGLFLALLFAVYASVRRRGELAEAGTELQKLVLADLLRRLAAGLIDAIPFAAPIVFVLQSIHSGNSAALDPIAANASGVETGWLLAGAMFVYLLHTAASETLTTRTLGKWLMGLRVVRLDGGTPDPAALLIRNFLRVMDVGLFGVPLVLIIFSPLRQRIGDFAAGTVVVRDRVKPEGNLIEPRKVETAVPTDVEPPAAEG
jgi:uncharacterized RDD family membrane protein YckC